jgi:hypothetical protein
VILYHFTSTEHVPVIFDSGVLALTDSMLTSGPAVSLTAPPVLWMLDTPELDGHPHGIDVPNWPVDKTEVRFTVDVPDAWVRKWVDWARAQGIRHGWLETVVRIGGGWDAAEHWMISFRKVPSDRWLEVRNMKTGEEVEL